MTTTPRDPNPAAGAVPPGSGLVIDRDRPNVVVLRLDRPDRLNAITVDLALALTDALRTIGRERGVRAIVLTGSGRAFSAGADLRRGDGTGGPRPERSVPPAAEDYTDAVAAIRSCRVPVIAAVNGVAIGFGMALALACDIRIAAKSASFDVGAVKLGLSAGEAGISWHLPRLIGASRAFELMLTARPVDADEAQAIGLARTVDDDQLMTAAMDVAVRISRHSPTAVRLTKQVAWSNLETSFAAAIDLENRTQALAATTADFREAMAAFSEKRPPDFDRR